MWPRALSLDEIREAFVQSPVLFRVGTENGSAGEFGAPEETADTFTVDQDSWCEFRGTLTEAKPEVTIAATLRGECSKVPYVLSVRTAPTAGQAELRPYINGQACPSKFLKPGAVARWFIPKTMLTSTSQVTVRLVRVSGTGSCALDFVEMAGSTQIGVNDKNQSEFSQEGYVQNETPAGQWNWKNYQRAVLSSWQGQEGGIRRKAHVLVWVPPALAANNRFRYNGMIVGQGADSTWTANKEHEALGYKLNQWPVTVYVNDKIVFKTEGSPNETPVSYEFEPGELKGGWNRITWFAHGAGKYWLCIDHHRLEVIDNPQCTFLIVR